MRIVTETITPAKAEALLLKSADQRQRPIDPGRVRLYARKMTDGQWRPTHQPIAIDPDGVLFDGQHRVSAIALSGVPIDLVVAYDADPATFDLIDTGRSRTPGHTLAIAGYTNTNVLAAAARHYLIYKLLEGTSSGVGPELRSGWTSHDILRFLESSAGQKVQGALSEATRVSATLGRAGAKTWLTASIALLDTAGVDAELRSEFLERLADGTMLAAGSPILSLRRWITSDTGYVRMRRGVASLTGMANFVKAWNAWVHGDVVQVTVFRPGIEVLPPVEAHAVRVGEIA